jgi:hypothetical protein
MRRIDSSLASIAVAAVFVTTTGLLAQDPTVKKAQAPAKGQVKVVDGVKAMPKANASEPGNGIADLLNPIGAVKALILGRPAPAAKVQANVMVRQVMPNPGVEQYLKNIEAQYTRQNQPVLRNELHFLRTICHLSEDQVKKITPEGEKALKATVEKAVAIQRAMMTGGFQQNMIYPDARKSIQDGLLNAAKAHLSPDQAAVYQAEVATRAAERKQAVIDNLVSKLDVGLVLSADQRVKIAEGLGTHWNESWLQSLESFQYADQYMPNLPDNLVSPHLNSTQKAVWRGGQKLNYWGAASVNPMVMELDEIQPMPAAPMRVFFQNAVPVMKQAAPAVKAVPTVKAIPK